MRNRRTGVASVALLLRPLTAPSPPADARLHPSVTPIPTDQGTSLPAIDKARLRADSSLRLPSACQSSSPAAQCAQATPAVPFRFLGRETAVARKDPPETILAAPPRSSRNQRIRRIQPIDHPTPRSTHETWDARRSHLVAGQLPRLSPTPVHARIPPLRGSSFAAQ